uniref:SCP domain-containing protein n=1 Tax=Panagrolaimus sp. ES5 TaxID=591445 RepID=A0AC34GB15_9BILA
MFQFFFIFTFLLFTTVLSQTTTTTSSSPSSEPDCLNPDLLLTPAFRKKILDDVNAGRNKLKNGQLLLNNGEYALVPESMPELNWSCDFEEEMHEYGRQYCETQQSPNQNWTSFTGFFNSEHAYLVNSGTHNLNYYTYPANYLSQHTIYTGFAPNNVISALHDKAEYLGCAIYDCQRDSNNENIFPSDPSYTIMNMMFCRVSPDVDFGEKVYEVSPTANANFPSQDVICGDGHGGDIEMRQIILEKINAVRQQIQQGTYILKNGYPALQAVNMPNLVKNILFNLKNVNN